MILSVIHSLILAQTLNANTVFKQTDGGWTSRVWADGVSVSSGGSSGSSWFPDGGFIGSVTLNGAVDPNNTTSVALGGGATFTGIATDLTNFAQIVGWAYANVASATNGMCVQFSSDATNWDTYSCRTLPAGATAVEGIPVMGRYFRFVYTNGAAAQTTFRLQSTMKTVPLTGTIGDIGVVPSTGTHGLYTQSVIVGKTTGGGGGYVPVKVNPSGALTVDATQGTSPWLVAGADGGSVSVVTRKRLDPVTSLITCNGAAVPLPATALTQRTSLQVYNGGPATIHIGPASVSWVTGMLLASGSYWSDDVGPALYYCATDGGTATVRVLEN